MGHICPISLREIKLLGTYPEESEILKTEVMYGASRSIQSFNNHVGIGSSAHRFSGAFRIKLVSRDVTCVQEFECCELAI